MEGYLLKNERIPSLTIYLAYERSVLIVFAILCTTIAFAQSGEQRIKEPGKTVFHPHWFIQTQIGAAHTVGEAKFADLISPAVALNVGYKFAPALVHVLV